MGVDLIFIKIKTNTSHAFVGEIPPEAATGTYFKVTLSIWCSHISPLSATYMRHWSGSSLVHLMACRLLGAKLLPEAMLTYCQLDP